MKRFRHFLGVDQTGAILRGGLAAKPLKAALLTETEKGWELTSKILSDFNQTAIQRAIGFTLNQETALVVDCVFGLSHEVWPSDSQAELSAQLWELFLLASRSSNFYGMKASEVFFRTLNTLANPASKSKTAIPKRQCELLAKANSVFLTRPFQKNIQTGTFRIWRDLVSENPKKWLNIWPFETSRTQLKRAPWIYEGFPSLFWRQVFGLKTRNLKLLRKAVETVFEKNYHLKIQVLDWNVFENDADLADAAVLALGALSLQLDMKLTSALHKHNAVRNCALGCAQKCAQKCEGWILGLENGKALL